MVRRVFRCPYIHIGAKKIAEIADTGVLSEEEQIAYAAEFVRRWNAFEDGGIVDELVVACEELYDIYKKKCTKQHIKFDRIAKMHRLVKQATAKAKPE